MAGYFLNPVCRYMIYSISMAGVCIQIPIVQRAFAVALVGNQDDIQHVIPYRYIRDLHLPYKSDYRLARPA